jgi:hypothetical protein
MASQVFERTWGIPAKSSWPEATRRGREKSLEFCFMAEVYWDMEWTMQQQGFNCADGKRLYDRLFAIAGRFLFIVGLFLLGAGAITRNTSASAQELPLPTASELSGNAALATGWANRLMANDPNVRATAQAALVQGAGGGVAFAQTIPQQSQSRPASGDF